MHFHFPLATRELERLARRDGFYLVRMALPALLVCILSIAWIAHEPIVSQIGDVCYVAAILFQFAVVTIVAPISAASIIARERAERTLGVLVLATAGGRDIVVSKFAARLLFCEGLIVTTIPVLAISVGFGGASAASCIADTVLNVSVAAMAVALGVLASSLADRPRTALWAAYALVIVAVGASIGVLGHRYWPIFNVPDPLAFDDTSILQIVAACTPTLGISVVVASVALFVACQIVERLVSFDGTMPAWRYSRHFVRATPKNSYQALRYLVSRVGSSRTLNSQVVRAVLLLAITLASFYFSPFSWPVIVAIVAYGAASHTQSLVRSSALDSLCLLPHDPKVIGRAVFETNFAASLVFLPAFVFASMRAIFLIPGIPSQLIALVASVTLGYATIRYASAQVSDCTCTQSPAVHAITTLVWFALSLSVAALISVLVGTSVFVVVGALRDADLTLFVAIVAFTMWIASYHLLMWGAKYPQALFNSSLEPDDAMHR